MSRSTFRRTTMKSGIGGENHGWGEACHSAHDLRVASDQESQPLIEKAKKTRPSEGPISGGPGTGVFIYGSGSFQKVLCRGRCWKPGSRRKSESGQLRRRQGEGSTAYRRGKLGTRVSKKRGQREHRRERPYYFREKGDADNGVIHAGRLERRAAPAAPSRSRSLISGAINRNARVITKRTRGAEHYTEGRA